MKTMVYAALFASIAFTVPAFAEEDAVSTADGSLAVMESGSTYQSTDGTDMSSWEGDDVTITNNGKMVNHSTGETADVEQVN